jgi:hypothetical protein
VHSKARAIACILVLAMHSLKTEEWGVFVGCHPTKNPHFYPLGGKNA